MYLSNYPPGVTGNEPQIAGYDDEDVDVRECNREVADENDETSICSFAGEVSIGWSGRIGYWVCPDCGWKHEDEAEEPDYYDLWNER